MSRQRSTIPAANVSGGGLVERQRSLSAGPRFRQSEQSIPVQDGVNWLPVLPDHLSDISLHHRTPCSLMMPWPQITGRASFEGAADGNEAEGDHHKAGVPSLQLQWSLRWHQTGNQEHRRPGTDRLLTVQEPRQKTGWSVTILSGYVPHSAHSVTPVTGPDLSARR